MSLPKASRAEGHFAHVHSVILLLFLGLGIGKGQRPQVRGSLELCATAKVPEHRDPGRRGFEALGYNDHTFQIRIEAIV